MDKHLVLLSGGFDSVIAILDLFNDAVDEEGIDEARKKIMGLFIRHNYRSGAREKEVAIRVAGRLGIQLIEEDGRMYDLQRGAKQHEVDMMVIGPEIAKLFGCTKILFGEDVGCDRDSYEEYLRVTVPGGKILAGADDWYKEHGYDLEYVAQFEVRRMEILKTHLDAFVRHSLSPLWDTYSCFSIVKPNQECGGCWKCFRKYMTCRTVMPREAILRRYVYDPVSDKNVKKLRKLLDLAEFNPKLFDEDGYALLDFKDMYRIAIEDSADVVDITKAPVL